MSSALARTALRRAAPQLRATVTRRAASTSAESATAERLSQAPKRDPELYVLGGIMVSAFAGAGYYFASKPTSSTSENHVHMVQNSQPWQSGTSGKYQYHPDGDRTRAPKDAPSALHSVIVPEVNLPKHLHELFNKYDDEEYDDY